MQGLSQSRKVVSPEAGVTDGWEPPGVGAGNWKAASDLKHWLHTWTPEMDAGMLPNVFVPLPDVATLTKSLLSVFPINLAASLGLSWAGG